MVARTLLLAIVTSSLLLGDWAAADNSVLKLQTRGDYVLLPTDLFLDFEEATVEAWVKWEDFSYYSQWFAFGSGARFQAMGLNHGAWTRTPQFFIYDRQQLLHVASVPANLPKGVWIHMAAVSGPDGMHMYLNGIESASDDFTGSFAAIGNGGASYLGRSSWVENLDFLGALDEVRVWNEARSGEQIRAAMYRNLRGDEPGLAALWNFDGPCATETIVRDRGSSAHHGRLVGGARCVEAALPVVVEPPALVEGSVRDARGALLSHVPVFLQEGGERVARGSSGENGQYRFERSATALSAGVDDLGVWRQGLDFSHEGGPFTVDLTLHRAVDIHGGVNSLEGTPQEGVIVQALSVAAGRDDGVAQSVQTDGRGKFRFLNLKPGKYRIRLHLSDRYLYAATPGFSALKAEASLFTVGDQGTTGAGTFQVTPARQGSWRTFDAFDGLTANQMTDIGSAADGMIWVGTAGSGVWSFDGEVFVNLTTDEGLVNDQVNSVTGTRDGAVWIGTQAGASRLANGEFTSFTTADGLADNVVRAIHEDVEGSIWFGTQRGLSLLVDGRFTSIETIDHQLRGVPITDVVVDTDGALWLATNSRGVWRYAAGEMTPLSVREGLASTRVHCILEARNGDMWFGTENGISHYDGAAFETYFNIEEEVAQHQIFDVHQSGDGTLWFATRGGGVISSDGTHFVNYTANDGLAHNVVGAIHEDFQGGIWFGSDDGRLSRFDTRVANMGTAHGIAEGGVMAVAVAEDGLWLGTDDGLQSWRDGRLTSVGQEQGLASLVSSLEPTPGGLWIGAFEGGTTHLEAGIWFYDGVDLRQITSRSGFKPFQDVVNDLQLDADGVLWAGTDGGILRLDGESHEFISDNRGPVVSVMAVGHDHEGRLYFGTEGSGVTVYEGDSVATLTTADGLADDHVTTIHTDIDGDLWVGTQGGVSRYDGSGFHSYTTRDGFPHNRVADIDTDGADRHWIATHGGGLAVFDGVNWSAVDTRDGLGDNRINALTVDRDGSVWLATESGLTHYIPNKRQPRVRLVEVHTDTLHTLPAAVPPVLAGSRVTFKYSAIDFETLPAKRRYRYRIAGQDSTWKAETRSGHVEWTPQEAGNFTFEVQTLDRSLNASEPARFAVTVVLPWHRDNRYLLPILIASLGILGTITALGRKGLNHRGEALRLRQQMQEQEVQARAVLERKNADLEAAGQVAEEAAAAAERANRAKSLFLANMSHELRTPLNAILGFAQILGKEDSLEERARNGISTIQRSGEHLLGLINDILDMSKIEAGRMELEPIEFSLPGMLEDLVQVFTARAEQQGISFSYQMITDLPVGVRGDEKKLRQVLINLLGNGIKFTQDGVVALRVSVRGDKVRFEVEDTGMGIAEESLEEIFEAFRHVEDEA